MTTTATTKREAIEKINAVLSGESEGCIVCGDCLDIMADMPDGSVDVVVTDPPYGHNNNNNGDLISRWEAALGVGEYVPERDNRAIANDGHEANTLYKDALPHMRRLLQPGCCCCCCCCGGGPDPQFARWSLWMDEVFNFKQMVVWDKGPMGMGWHYRRSYETVLVGSVPGAAIRWNGGRATENIIRPGDYGISKIIPQKTDHPCAKSPALYGHFINLHTNPGDIVLDPFAGEGPFAVAAKRLGRRYIGIEIDEGYCKKARGRVRDTERPLFQPETPPPTADDPVFAACGLGSPI